nr:GAF domain-containing protein [uncultured Sphaerochaeta sp.]
MNPENIPEKRMADDTDSFNQRIAGLESRLAEEISRNERQRQESDQAEQSLQETLEASRCYAHEVESLLQGARAMIKARSFENAARGLFDAAKRITGATSGYIALLNADGTENEVLFLDSGGLPCTVDPSLPMPIRGLREVAYRTGRTVFDNSFASSRWADFMPEGHVLLKNVMFAPLTIEGRTVGLLGLANNPEDFTDRNAEMATAFGELASMALREARINEERDCLINELQHALSQIKTLQGLIPICAKCKKIRDDKGFWQQVENYIQERSSAQFSHGICPECAQELYPDLFSDDPDESEIS